MSLDDDKPHKQCKHVTYHHIWTRCRLCGSLSRWASYWIRKNWSARFLLTTRIPRYFFCGGAELPVSWGPTLDPSRPGHDCDGFRDRANAVCKAVRCAVGCGVGGGRAGRASQGCFAQTNLHCHCRESWTRVARETLTRRLGLSPNSSVATFCH